MTNNKFIHNNIKYTGIIKTVDYGTFTNQKQVQYDILVDNKTLYKNILNKMILLDFFNYNYYNFTKLNKKIT